MNDRNTDSQSESICVVLAIVVTERFVSAFQKHLLDVLLLWLDYFCVQPFNSFPFLETNLKQVRAGHQIFKRLYDNRLQIIHKMHHFTWVMLMGSLMFYPLLTIGWYNQFNSWLIEIMNKIHLPKKEILNCLTDSPNHCSVKNFRVFLTLSFKSAQCSCLQHSLLGKLTPIINYHYSDRSWLWLPLTGKLWFILPVSFLVLEDHD